LITSCLSIKKKDRPKILDIINMPFVKKRIIQYIKDTLNADNLSTLTDLDDLVVDSLKEQA